MKNIIAICLSAIVFVALPGFESRAHEINATSVSVNTQVNISGLLKEEFNLTINDLKKLKISEIKGLKIISRSGAVKEIVKSYKGVLLKDIIKSDEIRVKNWHELNEVYLVAEAIDDYKVVFSWNEIINSPIGDGVLIVFEKNGKSLDETEGKIILISSKDYRTGPRHVKWLKKISIKKI